MLCGLDDGSIHAWSLHDRRTLVEYEPCPAPVVCVALTDSCLLIGTSRSDIIKYHPPPLEAVLLPGIRLEPIAPLSQTIGLC
mmetsp:Transcript_33170/g.54811  ORF Transcript_33170/g.54811 Transcript_33170/m.54811 type:complete len:82 (+) Transcript_33170:3-248(+)